MTEYTTLTVEQRLSQIDARIQGIEQELFSAQLNIEMEEIINDETGSRNQLIDANKLAVVHATKRLQRLRELRAELVAEVPFASTPGVDEPVV